jgi:hypothetical protein
MHKLFVFAAVLFLSAVTQTQSPVQEVADEKEPELRVELVKMAIADQNMRGEFDRFRRAKGLFVDNKTLNEMFDKDPVLKKEFLDVANRMTDLDKVHSARLKEIVTKYGWPGRTLVGTEAAASAWLMLQHADYDVAFQRMCLELIKKMPPCEVENSQFAELTDRVLLNEGKKQLYGTMPVRTKDGTLVPKPIEDEANVDKRRAELGLQPLAEYMRRLARNAGIVRN